MTRLLGRKAGGGGGGGDKNNKNNARDIKLRALIVVAIVLAFSQTIKETKDLGMIGASFSSWWSRSLEQGLSYYRLVWKSNNTNNNNNGTTINFSNNNNNNLTTTTTTSRGTIFAAAVNDDDGNNHNHNGNIIIPSPMDLFYEERRNHYYALVCSNVTSITRTTTQGYFMEFCFKCSFDGGPTMCGSKTVWYVGRYNTSIREATKLAVQNQPENCCIPIQDKRVLAGQQVPGQQRKEETNRNVPHQEDTTSSSSSTNTAWCILGGNNTPPNDWLSGFPHSAEALIPCWSYFCRVWQQQPQLKCGIWFEGGEFGIDVIMKQHYLQVHGHPNEAWVSGLMEGMNCTFGFEIDHSNNNLPGKPHMIQPNSWQYRPIVEHEYYDEFFQHPNDATLLHQRMGLETSDQVNAHNNTSQTKRPLRIGLVQRRGTARHITNFPEVEALVRKAYPEAILEWGEMENKTFWQQATYWNRQDVIVAAHGAAVTNAIFMRQNTALVEVFPQHYYVMMYRDLCVSAGIYWFGWTHDTEFLYFDFDSHLSKRLVRWAARANALQPPVDRIMDLIHQAVNVTTIAQGI